MRKQKVSALTLIIAVMITGIGYAVWADKLTVNNTVSTGELKVEFVKDELYPGISVLEDYKESNNSNLYNERKTNYINFSINQNENTAEFDISNMYPGSKAKCILKIMNTGTIPALVDGFKVNFDDSTSKDLKEKLMIKLRYIKYKKDGTRYVDNSVNRKMDVEKTFVLSNLEYNLNDMLKNERLEPGEWIILGTPEGAEGSNMTSKSGIVFYLPSKIVNEDKIEKTTAKFSITMEIKQAN